jgi:hypothetical protein
VYLAIGKKKQGNAFCSHSQVRQCHYEDEYGLLEKQQYALLEKATLALSNCNRFHTVHSYSKKILPNLHAGFKPIGIFPGSSLPLEKPSLQGQELAW